MVVPQLGQNEGAVTPPFGSEFGHRISANQNSRIRLTAGTHISRANGPGKPAFEKIIHQGNDDDDPGANEDEHDEEMSWLEKTLKHSFRF